MLQDGLQDAFGGVSSDPALDLSQASSGSCADPFGGVMSRPLHRPQDAQSQTTRSEEHHMCPDEAREWEMDSAMLEDYQKLGKGAFGMVRRRRIF